MKKVIAIVALAAAGSAYAQLNPLPPASGIAQQGIGVNAATWGSSSSLGAYNFTSDVDLTTPRPGTPDNALGLFWGPTSSMAAATKNTLGAEGGTVRAIFLGESAGWANDFGFTLSGNPAGPNSFSLINNIQSLTGTTDPVNVKFGDHWDIGVAAGTGANFDFWLNAVGGFGPTPPTPPTEFGGVYTAFDQTNSSPFISPGNVLWTVKPILVSTYINATLGYQDVATYLVSVEDWRLDRGSDKDFNDFMFAVQFFKSDGTPFAPVPEPSTYGLFGAAALVGLVAFRRFKSKKA